MTNQLFARLLTALFVICCGISTGTPVVAADDNRSPTVGVRGRVIQLKLPGTQLRGRPLDDDKIPIVARVERTPLAYDGGFQYDIVFYGLKPGKYNLAEFLVRIDGSSTEDLPEVPIEIMSLLPADRNQPNALSDRWLPKLGGYRFLMTLAVVFWIVVLVWLIFSGRRGKKQAGVAQRQLTLADYLKPRIEAAMSGKLAAAEYAELERMLTAFWRKKLDLETTDPAQAIRQLRSHEQAGPLLGQLEQWLHNPNANRSINLAQLLAPYENISLDVIEQHGSAGPERTWESTNA